MSQDLYTQLNNYLEEEAGKKLIKAVDYDLNNFSDALDRAIRSRNAEEIDAALDKKDDLRRRIKNNVGLEAAVFFDKAIKELTK